MNLARLLAGRVDRPVRVGLIGAGKFGSMYLAQARRTPGVHVVGIADISPARAREALRRSGWPEGQVAAPTLDVAFARGSTALLDDAERLIAFEGLDVVIEATGDPAAGIHHALRCCRHGHDVIMVNVEADALAGPLLARRAAEAGIIYSLAYGDQPSLICELVDWARAMVYGRLMRAGDSLARGALPIGLAQGSHLRAAVRAGEVVRWGDVQLDETSEAVRARRDLERMEPRY